MTRPRADSATADPATADPETPTVLRVPTRVLDYAGSGSAGERPVAVEAPVNLVYGNVPYAVMMASPADLDDFAYGFSLTEGVVEDADEIRGVRLTRDPDGMRLHVDLAPGRLREHLARKRAISGRTGCGVCGIEDLAALPLAVAAPAPPVQVALPAIARALAELGDAQALNRETRAVHAAAFARLDGSLVASREDVGRHNALDKLIGALIRGRTDPAAGFVVITSRCSFEMVEKAARLGTAVIIAISAPTSLALARARQHGLTLCAIARSDTLTVFTGAQRLTGIDGPAADAPPP